MNSIRIKAFPESKKPAIEVVEEKVLRVFVRESAQNNQANKAVIRAVATYYNIPENKLRMISGHRGLNKTIQILE
jgi:uncharacterized protein YggU (UPF0235/DUF167 family)